jgi:hypothetical protein
MVELCPKAVKPLRVFRKSETRERVFGKFTFVHDWIKKVPEGFPLKSDKPMQTLFRNKSCTS